MCVYPKFSVFCFHTHLCKGKIKYYFVLCIEFQSSYHYGILALFYMQRLFIILWKEKNLVIQCLIISKHLNIMQVWESALENLNFISCSKFMNCNFTLLLPGDTPPIGHWNQCVLLWFLTTMSLVQHATWHLGSNRVLCALRH